MSPLLRFATAIVLLAPLAAACGGSEDSADTSTTPAASPATPVGQAVGKAKVVITNGGTKPLYFFREGLEVGEPYIRTQAVGSPICGGQMYERRYMDLTEVAAGATYEATFGGIAVARDAARDNCLYFEYVAAKQYPGRVCAYETKLTGYASLGRPSVENMPKPTHCVDFTLDLPATGESITKVTLP